MDDEEELKDFNLSSRVLREESRRQRERGRLERELERERSRRMPARPPSPSGESNAQERPAEGMPGSDSSDRCSDDAPQRGDDEVPSSSSSPAEALQGLDRARARVMRSLTGGYAAWEKSLGSSDDAEAGSAQRSGGRDGETSPARASPTGTGTSPLPRCAALRPPGCRMRPPARVCTLLHVAFQQRCRIERARSEPQQQR